MSRIDFDERQTIFEGCYACITFIFESYHSELLLFLPIFIPICIYVTKLAILREYGGLKHAFAFKIVMLNLLFATVIHLNLLPLSIVGSIVSFEPHIGLVLK